MIFRAHIGQRVEIRHAKARRGWFLHHGAVGTVLCHGHGPGPRNVAVRLDTGEFVCVPRGNVRAWAPPAQVPLW